jgi:CheY-like chemotaxis protein
VLARGIAHNFNNILSTIIGYTRLAMDDVEENSLTYANLNEVLKAGDRAKVLVEQMLEFGRASEPKREPLDLREAVSEALDSIEENLPVRTRVQRDLDIENAVVLANPGQIDQMIVNLLDNAVSAMAEAGGVLGVRLFRSDSGIRKESSPFLVRAGRHVVLTISDTGAGMSNEVRRKIFDPFFTTKNIGNGTGMGLAVVHGIVTGHGGVIDVRSEPGKGTVFDVYLPQVPVGVKAASKNGGPIGHEGKRVLVVDDEEPLVRLADQLLSKEGYEVVARTVSREALSTFEEDPGGFDAVITDMLMPDLRGDEMAVRMLAIRPNIPIVLMTGSDHEKSREDVVAHGFSVCLPKPFTPESLSEAVRKALSAAGID